MNAINRLGSASGWVRVDGKPWVNTQADLANGNQLYPLRITEFGADVQDQQVFTGTLPNGTIWTSSSTCPNGSGGVIAANCVCADWTSTTLAACGSTGTQACSADTGSSAGTSSIFTSFGSVNCNSTARLYCLGVDRAAAVVVTPPNPRRTAFLSNNVWTPGGGIAAADSLCQSEAQAAGLTGTYLALIATTSAGAASRFSTSGAPWVRVDGVPITASATNMFSATFWDAPINLTANGTSYYGNNGTWGGSTSFANVGSNTLTCSNWAVGTASGTGGGGRAGHTYTPYAFALDTSNPCNATYIRVFCLQQ
ncbi:MAG: hypothetical protein QM723_16690 [Myxococcaceae bacterium]